LPEWAREGRRVFVAALDDDLNMPEGLAALFDMIHAGHKAIDEATVAPATAAAVCDLLDELDRVLGIRAESEAPGADVRRLAQLRQAAREERNWEESDRLRDRLAEMGWDVRDTPQGPKLKKNSRV
jgi:cysteinyl-tRNA synthetase